MNKYTIEKHWPSIYEFICYFASFYAVYLSWSQNTIAGVYFIIRIIQSIFAFWFGVLYIMFHFIFIHVPIIHKEMHSKLKKNKFTFP
jgi:uncharacterized membrane protein